MIKEESKVDHNKVLEDYLKKQKDRIRKLKEKCKQNK